MRRALVLRAGALGDILLLRRAVAALKAGGYAVDLLAPEASGRVLVGTGGSEADRLIRSDAPELSGLWHAGGMPDGLARTVGPCALALACTADADVAANLGGLAARVLVQPPAPPAGVHAADWLARPLEPIGLAIPAVPPPLVFSDDEREAARTWRERLPERIVALHPGSGSPRKNWPAERFAVLADALAPSAPFLVVAGPADEAAVDATFRGRERAVVARCLPPRVLGALLAQAALFVGNDSGVTHLAAATGARCVAVFGPSDPAQWAPVGPRVRVVAAPGGRLGDVGVDDVLRAT